MSGTTNPFSPQPMCASLLTLLFLNAEVSIGYVVSLIRSRKTDIHLPEIVDPAECRNIPIMFHIRSQHCANGLIISRCVGDCVWKVNVSLLTLSPASLAR